MNLIGKIHDTVWGPWTPVLFLLVGIVYSVRIRFFQLRKIPRWWDATIGNLLRDRKNHRESFRSACTALAATIGTGNITGVAAAVIAGGPGAVFWMWVSAFLGMATAYGETVLGIRYREKGRDGGWMAGPMIYLEKRLGCPGAAVLYGFFCIPAAFGMGSMVQANAISETVSYVYGIPEAAVGVILVVLAGNVLAGGGRRIFLAAERLVPVSAGLYTAAALAVIILYAGNVPGVILGILTDAFSFRSAVGGVAGYGISRCVSYGIARGVFSNEAGLGSLAVLNGSAEMAEEELQGQWAIFEVFFDTIVSCTLTALVILCVAGSGTVSEFGAENGASLTSLCFFTALGSPGGYAVAVCVVLFAFSTIIAWYYMGRQAAEYLGGKISGKIPAVYTVGYLLAAFFGCLGAMETVWEVSDIFNGLMAVPNLAALVLLAGEIYAPGENQDP